MEPTTSLQQVCETCGDEGVTNAYVYCIKCLGGVIHRYCLDVMPATNDEIVYWLCEDCEPTVSNQFTSPQLSSSSPKKVDAADSPLLTTAHSNNNIKKKTKTAPLVVAGKDKVTCVSPVSSPLKEALVVAGNNKTPPCVVSQLKKGVLDKNCCSLKGNAKRKRKRNPSCPSVKTKEDVTKKEADLTEDSCCDSGCTDVSLKKMKKDARCESQRCETKLVSDSLSFEKELNKKNKKTKGFDCQEEMKDEMHNKKEDIKGGGDASKSVDVENNVNNNKSVDGDNNVNNKPARPAVNPLWRGSFNITETDYDQIEGFVGHLSSKACYKVSEEARMLPPSLCLEMHSKTTLWPKSFLDSPPTDENIALFFFPGDSKSEKDFQRLVLDMVEEGLAMRAITKNAELLIFTSTVLPRSNWRIQGKYYLWGVFKGKRNDPLPPMNHKHSVSKKSVNHGTEVVTRVKRFDSRSPQSPLCNHSDSDRGLGWIENAKINNFNNVDEAVK